MAFLTNSFIPAEEIFSPEIFSKPPAALRILREVATFYGFGGVTDDPLQKLELPAKDRTMTHLMSFIWLSATLELTMLEIKVVVNKFRQFSTKDIISHFSTLNPILLLLRALPQSPPLLLKSLPTLTLLGPPTFPILPAICISPPSITPSSIPLPCSLPTLIMPLPQCFFFFVCSPHSSSAIYS